MKILTRNSGMTLLAAAMITVSGAVSAGVPEVCAACHNDNGVSSDAAVPTLAGNAAFFIENQLFMFAEGTRACAADYFTGKADVSLEDHCVAVADLSEDQIAEIGAAYEGMDYVAFEQDFDADLAAAGESIHNAACEKCHSDAGSVMEDESGILAGQPKAYIVAQLKHYRADERPPTEMQKPAHDLSDDDINALAEFYAREGKNRF
jgi:cytochrome c553